MHGAIYLMSSGEGGTRSTVDAIANTHDAIIFALIGIIGTSVAALVYTIKNHSRTIEGVEQAKQVNAAVNNIGPGEHRLYDMVEMIRDDIQYLTETQRAFAAKGWSNLPADLANAPALTQVIRDLQHRDQEVIDKLETIEETLREHVDWEMQAKYEEVELLKRQAMYIQAETGIE